jgi:hypothetical protein
VIEFNCIQREQLTASFLPHTMHIFGRVSTGTANCGDRR